MAVMDEFRAEREAMKHGTPKQKLAYYWGYYKWHVIIAITLISIITYFIYTVVTRKDVAFHALFINSVPLMEDTEEAYIQGFSDKLGLDTKKYEVRIDNSVFLDLNSMDEDTYASTQRINTYVSAGEVDIIGADIGVFKAFAYLDYMADLRQVLTPEQIETYSPYFFYIDRDVIAMQEEARANSEEITIVYPDHTKPEEMEDPVPVGILLDNVSEDFSLNYTFSDGQGVIGFLTNSGRTENALEFLEYMFTAE